MRQMVKKGNDMRKNGIYIYNIHTLNFAPPSPSEAKQELQCMPFFVPLFNVEYVHNRNPVSKVREKE